MAVLYRRVPEVCFMTSASLVEYRGKTDARGRLVYCAYGACFFSGMKAYSQRLRLCSNFPAIIEQGNCPIDWIRRARFVPVLQQTGK
jgi:hypothetical protein